MAAVSEIYQRIIHQQHERREQQQLEPAFELRSPASSVSPDAPEERLLAQLANDLPAMHARVVDLDPHARRGLLRFLASALRTSGRYAAVVRNPTAAERALAIFETSDFLSEILIRYPEEIATLADLRAIALRMGSGYLFHPEPGRVLLAGEEGAIPPPPASDPVFAYIAASGQSYSEKLALLRQHYRHLVFTSGAKDISDARDVYQSLATNTAAADDAITAAFQIAGSPTGLAVLALGRLGSEEFDLLSDADLLFVCDESADLAVLRKATEQIIHSLAAYTRDGLVFPVDARLRPHGGQGELLVTPAQLRSYFQKDAKPWEALVYTKLRFICGAPELAKGAANAARELPARFAGDREFVPAIREMRVKLEHADSGELNFKSSAGAIYDIEFLCSYLGLKGGTLPQAGTLRERLWACVAAGALNNSDAAFLDHAAELFRTAEHITRLVVGRRQKWLPTTEHSRNLVQKLTGRILGRSFLHGLEGELNEVRTRTRQIYESKLQA